MSDLNINNITDRTGVSGPVIAGVSTVTGTGAFTVPVGPTEYRGGRGRGVYALMYSGSPSIANSNVIEYIEIATTGNSADFGDRSAAARYGGATSSSTRGFLGGGYTGSPASVTNLDFVIISSKGGGNDFGDLVHSTSEYGNGTMASTTRGFFIGGEPGAGYRQFIEMSSTGNCTDFGNFDYSQFYGGEKRASSAMPVFSNPTRGVYCSGHTPTLIKACNYINMQSLGKAKFFGDLIVGRIASTGTGSATRGMVFGGDDFSTPYTDSVEYLTIASGGDATDFGNLSSGIRAGGASTNTIRAVYAGGYNPSTNSNVMEYFTITSTGNATDFGDLTVPTKNALPCNDSYGGLG